VQQYILRSATRAIRFFGADNSAINLPSGSILLPVVDADADGFILVECNRETFSMFSKDFNECAVLASAH
jgi:hypothetical protein